MFHPAECATCHSRQAVSSIVTFRDEPESIWPSWIVAPVKLTDGEVGDEKLELLASLVGVDAEEDVEIADGRVKTSWWVPSGRLDIVKLEFPLSGEGSHCVVVVLIVKAGDEGPGRESKSKRAPLPIIRVSSCPAWSSGKHAELLTGKVQCDLYTVA